MTSDPALFFHATTLDELDQVSALPLPEVVQDERMPSSAWGRLELPGPVVHPAAEAAVAAALDISLNQLERILGEDLALDADNITRELDEVDGPTGMSAIANNARDLGVLVDFVPVHPTMLDDGRLETLFEACRCMRDSPDSAAHQALYEAVWGLVAAGVTPG